MSNLLRTKGLTSDKPGLYHVNYCDSIKISVFLTFSAMKTHHILQLCKSFFLFCHSVIYLTLLSSVRSLHSCLNWPFFTSFFGLHSENQYLASLSQMKAEAASSTSFHTCIFKETSPMASCQTKTKSTPTPHCLNMLDCQLFIPAEMSAHCYPQDDS